MKICVYSAIFGDYDNIKEQPKQSVPTDFILFSDVVKFSDTWNIIKYTMNSEYPNNRRKAKYFKIKPHEIEELKNYNYTIWVDGSARIKSNNFVKEILKYLDKSNFMVFKHPEDRDCIYDEAQYCKDFPKYRNEPIDEQVNYYKTQGYPKHNGLYACGMIVRKGNTEEINNSWWVEIRKYSYQDQISLPFVLWKLNKKIKVLELDQYDNPLIEFNMLNHKSLI